MTSTMDRRRCSPAPPSVPPAWSPRRRWARSPRRPRSPRPGQYPEPGQPDPNFAEGLITGRDQDLLQVTGIRRPAAPDPADRRDQCLEAPADHDRPGPDRRRPVRARRTDAGRDPGRRVGVDQHRQPTVAITSIGRSGEQLDHHGQKVVGTSNPASPRPCTTGRPRCRTCRCSRSAGTPR